MTLKTRLQENKDALLDRWLRDTMDTYAEDTSQFLDREKDRFANPVGHSLRTGARGILEGLLEGMQAEEICRHLNDIIKIRAIQDFTPSRAVSFVFLLKGAIRSELSEDESRRFSAELAEIDAEIDQIALFAFDIYSRCREQVSELRINEVKRSVAAVMQRLAGDDSGSDEAAESNGDPDSRTSDPAPGQGDREQQCDPAPGLGDLTSWQGGGR